MAVGVIRALSCSMFLQTRRVNCRASRQVGKKAQREGTGASCGPQEHSVSPIQVLPDGSGQAPAHILAAEDEGPAGEKADQGLCPAPAGGEGAAPAGEGPARQGWGGLGQEPFSSLGAPGKGGKGIQMGGLIRVLLASATHQRSGRPARPSSSPSRSSQGHGCPVRGSRPTSLVARKPQQADREVVM